MVHGKNIFLVLDDLVCYDDLIPFIRTTELLGVGSRIIITTRDEGVLKLFKKHHIYRVKLLSRDEALQFFCRKAFRCDFPGRGYDAELINRAYDAELINRALEYASGLPLAIVKLGSYLYNARSYDWSTALPEFKKVASVVVMKVLERSFRALNFFDQEMFLDIACFFVGKEVKYVQGILDCQFYAPQETSEEIMFASHLMGDRRRLIEKSPVTSIDQEIQMHSLLQKMGISVEPPFPSPWMGDIKRLIEKSLVTIIDQKIQMHSLLQEMGRKIVQQEFPSKPEKWSRLWDFNDIYRVMQNGTATLNVGSIVLDLEDSQRSPLNVEALSRMSNLRLLIFRNVKFFGVLEHLSGNLQYISWNQYPFTSLPSSFRPCCLRELILPDSCITSIWDNEEKVADSSIRDAWGRKWTRVKEFSWLRNINLSGSKDLIKLPNFKVLPSLERLEFEGCPKISQLDPSIASLSKLKFLNLRNCSKLVSIPNDLFFRPSLEMLNLACCSKLAYCLKYRPVDDLEELGERESFSNLSCKRQKLYM